MALAVFGGDFFLSILVPPQVTRRPRRILILGETGCGKEAVAKVLGISLEKAFGAKKIVAVSAADLPDQLLDAALFGHEKGAYTGAIEARQSLLAEANEGVLFIDEVGEASATVQAKLLRVLETGMYRRLGGQVEQESRFHLIAATNRPRLELQNSAVFRKDLFFRLADEIIEVPPLREILSNHDNPRILFETLAEHVAKREILDISNETAQETNASDADLFLGQYVANAFNSRVARQIANQLKHYQWPGNLRECNHFIRKIFESGGAHLDPNLIKNRCKELLKTNDEPSGKTSSLPVNLRKALEDLERGCYVSAVEQSSSIQQVANLLKVTRQTAARCQRRSDIVFFLAV